MAEPTSIPTDLLTFPCETGLRTLTLLQESRARLLEAQLEAVRKDIKTSREIGEQLVHAGDFGALAALPAALFRSQAEHYATLMQAWMRLAIHDQNAVLEQLRETGESWQRCQTSLWQHAANPAALAAPVKDLFEKLSQPTSWMPSATEPAATTAATAGGKSRSVVHAG
ncbi:phasin family protein [Cupriavidus basilensis]|uniref:phasin family protein n=1 Tax=Cupriavidus basilensis TaxID=68895 RepID=UPI000750AFB4|nr:phasin family protein [Cupriavidus basilensis]